MIGEISLITISIIVIYIIYKLAFSYMSDRHYEHISQTIKYIQVKIPLKTNDADTKTDNIQNMKSNIEVMNQIFKNFSSIIDKGWSYKIFGEKFISMQILVEKEAIKYILAIPQDYLETFEKIISSFYIGSLVEYISAPKMLEAGKYMSGGYFLLNKDSNYPIKTYETFEIDPMDSILSAFSRVGYDEKLILEIMTSPLGDGLHNKMRKQAEKIKESKGSIWKLDIIGLIRDLISKTGEGEKTEKKEEKKNIWSSGQQGDLDKKVEDELFAVNIKVLATSPISTRPDQIIQDISRAFNQYNYIGFNSWKYQKTKDIYWFAKNFVSRIYTRHTRYIEKIIDTPQTILNIKELSSIYHFPHSRYNRNPRIKRQKYKIVPAPDNLPSEGIVLGYNIFGGVKKEIRLQPDDRFRHFYCIGQTGTGKTTMLLTMSKDDLINHRGFCFIDPHGDFCEYLLNYYPKDRIDDLIYFNVADFDYPIGFNVLETKTEEEKDIVISDLIEMFVGMYGPEIFGPRIIDYFQNACYLLMDQPDGGTMSEILRLFTDPAFLTVKLANCKNVIIRTRREKTYKSMGDREKSEIIPYLQAKFAPFTTSGIVRNIIGQPKSSFDIGDMMQQNKVILVNLSKGLVGEENSKLIGNFISTQIKVSALRRAGMLEKDRVPFFLYIDEFQNYINKSIESILSEARKYKLGLAVAHQYIDQLKQKGLGGSLDLGDAIFGNVGSIMSYKVGAKDAEFLEKEYSPEFSQSDLVNMDSRMGVMKLSVNTQPTRPFTVYATNPYTPAINTEEKKTIIKQISALKRGRQKDLVEKEIFFRVGI